MLNSTATEGNSPRRPQTPNKSHSFTRLASARSSPLSRSRASTIGNGIANQRTDVELEYSSLDENRRLDQDDFFEKDTLVSSAQGKLQSVNELDLPEGFDKLPIELVSLIDRYELFYKYSWRY